MKNNLELSGVEKRRVHNYLSKLSNPVLVRIPYDINISGSNETIRLETKRYNPNELLKMFG